MKTSAIIIGLIASVLVSKAAFAKDTSKLTVFLCEEKEIKMSEFQRNFSDAGITTYSVTSLSGPKMKENCPAKTKKMYTAVVDNKPAVIDALKKAQFNFMGEARVPASGGHH